MIKKIEKQPHGRDQFSYCEAKTRQSSTCKRVCAFGKKRCYMHGGAPGSGAPKGNRNALKHGNYTKAAIMGRKNIRLIIKKLLDSYCHRV